jgi:hypothetical protein
LILVVVLVLAGLAIWLLPKTRLLKRQQISEAAFLTTCVVGILCGVTGLVATFAWPERVLEWHLWEVMAMPLVLAYVYWLLVMRKAGTGAVLDEKQEMDMVHAGSFTFALSIPSMMVASVLHDKGFLDVMVWFPYYLFVTLLIFSATALYRFKRR